MIYVDSGDEIRIRVVLVVISVVMSVFVVNRYSKYNKEVT